MTKKGIAIIGGTFDPCHKGHIDMAKYISDNYLSDEIWMIPSYDSPHKNINSINTYDDRVKMLEIATSGINSVKVSTIEKEYYNLYKCKTYSYEILKYIRSKFSNIYIYFVIGFDSIKHINTWFNYIELLKENDFYIFDREDDEFKTIEQKKFYLDNLGLKYGFKFHYDLFNVKIPNVSSTNIRNLLINDRINKLKITKYIDEKVYSYIISNNLYNI